MQVSSIRIGVRFLIVFRAQLVLFPGIRKAAVQADFKPSVTVRGGQSFRQVQVGGCVLFRQLVHGQVAHIVGETDVGMGTDVEFLVA